MCSHEVQKDCSEKLIKNLKKGNVSIVCSLIDQFSSLADIVVEGESLLHIASNKKVPNSAILVDFFLKNGANDQIMDKNRRTPIHCAIQTENIEAIWVYAKHQRITCGHVDLAKRSKKSTDFIKTVEDAFNYSNAFEFSFDLLFESDYDEDSGSESKKKNGKKYGF